MPNIKQHEYSANIHGMGSCAISVRFAHTSLLTDPPQDARQPAHQAIPPSHAVILRIRGALLCRTTRLHRTHPATLALQELRAALCALCVQQRQPSLPILCLRERPHNRLYVKMMVGLLMCSQHHTYIHHIYVTYTSHGLIMHAVSV